MALLVIAVCLVLDTGGPPEPVYNDKPLTYWLRRGVGPRTWFGRRGSLPPEEEAVKTIGTNAIPTLLRLLRAHDGRVKRLVGEVARELPFIHFSYWPAVVRHEAALFGFLNLHSKAKCAVPDLIELYQEKVSEDSQEATARALAFIGRDAEAAVPVLLQGASNAPTLVRAASIYALGEIQTSAELVVPVLINSLKDSDIYVRAAAADALAKFGIKSEAAKPAVPALVNALSDTNESLNAAAEEALKVIDPAALEKARKEGKERPR